MPEDQSKYPVRLVGWKVNAPSLSRILQWVRWSLLVCRYRCRKCFMKRSPGRSQDEAQAFTRSAESDEAQYDMMQEGDDDDESDMVLRNESVVSRHEALNLIR